MAIYSRRRLQSMLDELGHALPRGDATQLLNRLNNIDSTTALAGEAELSLLWALDKVSHIVVEPEVPNTNSRIDAISLDLLESGVAAVEVRAISDRSFSGEEDMERAANIISQFANGVLAGSGSKLFFAFGVGQELDRDGRRRRVRLIKKDYKLTAEHKEQLRDWIRSDDRPQTLSLINDKIGVVIRWEEAGVHPAGRVFCSMPPVAEHLEDNPLFRALKAKEAQFSKMPAWITRVVFIADAGSHTLWSAHTMGVSTKSAEEIVWHFLAKSKVSVVCLFSPRRPQNFLMRTEPMRWHVRIFDRRKGLPETEYARLHALGNALPLPSLEGYQARQRYQQGYLQARSKAQYRAPKLTTSRNRMTIQVSARAVQELVAGIITPERFHQIAFGDSPNFVAKQLIAGRTLQVMRIEDRQLDDDDDLLVMEFADDAAAAPFRKPATPTLHKRISSWLLRLLMNASLRMGIQLSTARKRSARDDTSAL